MATVTSDVITVRRHAAILEGRLLEARRVYERSGGLHTIWVPSAPQGHRYTTTNSGNECGDGKPPAVGSATSPTPSPPADRAPNGPGIVGTSDGTANGSTGVCTTLGTSAEVPQEVLVADTVISTPENDVNGNKHKDEIEEDLHSISSSDSHQSSASVVLVLTDPGCQMDRILPRITEGKHSLYQHIEYQETITPQGEPAGSDQLPERDPSPVAGPSGCANHKRGLATNTVASYLARMQVRANTPTATSTVTHINRVNSATARAPRANPAEMLSHHIQTPIKTRCAYIFDVPSIFNSEDVTELARESLGNNAFFRLVKLVRGGITTSDWTCELDARQFRALKGNIKLAGRLYRVRIKDTENIMASAHKNTKGCMRCGSNTHRVQMCPQPKRRKSLKQRILGTVRAPSPTVQGGLNSCTLIPVQHSVIIRRPNDRPPAQPEPETNHPPSSPLLE